jgi:hypothetical protein
MIAAVPLKGQTMIRRKETSAPTRGKQVRGGTIINVITVLVIFGLIAYGIYWILKTTGKAGQEYMTAVVNTHDKSLNIACESNLSAIYKTILTYAIGNEGYPPDQQELVSFSGYGSKLFHCPDPNGGEYIYVPGHRPDASTPSILVYETKPVHSGKCNVLLSDGQIGQLTPDELQQALTATRARAR